MELHRLFFDLRDRLGQTFVIVTHDEELARLTDRTIHLADGRVVGETARGADGAEQEHGEELKEAGEAEMPAGEEGKEVLHD